MTPPPIASPHSPQSAPLKPPFRGLRIFVAVDALFLVLGPLISLSGTHAHKQQLILLLVCAIYIPLWGLLLWRLWHGSGAARAIFLWMNAASVLATPFQHARHLHLSGMARGFGVVSTIFLIFSLVWLQLPGVKAHFRRDKAA